MSDSKHTPGPWRVDSFLEEQGLFKIGKQGRVLILAHVPSYEEEAYTEEERANANLIAAAPEMHEALKTYLNAGHKEARREASIIAKEALAKAEGKGGADE